MRKASRAIPAVLFLTLSAFALSACEGAKQQMGLSRQAPDEFAVVQRAPLAMPPEYTLRPPQPGAPRPQEAQSGEQARTVIFGDDGSRTSGTAPARSEAFLLQQAGSDSAEPDIRARVDQETAQLAPQERPVAERLFGWTRGSNQEPAATVLNPEEEAERLRQSAKNDAPDAEDEAEATSN